MMAAAQSPSGVKKGAANAASSNGKGTRPRHSSSDASKAGFGLHCRRRNAARLKTARAYHASNGTPATRNCGSGSASNQSIAAHSNSQTRLRQTAKKLVGVESGPTSLKAQSRSSDVKEKRDFASMVCDHSLRRGVLRTTGARPDDGSTEWRRL